MQYYFLNENNQRVGPVDVSSFTVYGVRPETYVWREGLSSWERAGSLPELSGLWRSAPQPYAPQPYAPQPYAPQPPVHRVVASAEEVVERPANRNVLLIIAMVITTIPWYMIGLCLTIPLGVLSIVFGNHVRNAIDAGRTDYCRAYAKLARAFSIVVIVFFIICLVLDGILLTVAIFN